MGVAAAPLRTRAGSPQLVRAGHRVVGTLAGLFSSAVLLAAALGAVAVV
jgi:hypothetical protein